MRGEIADYKDSLRRRVALLKGVTVASMQAVYEERLQLNPGAATLVSACKAAGLKVLLVSGGFTFFTDRIRARLGLNDPGGEGPAVAALSTAATAFATRRARLEAALLQRLADRKISLDLSDAAREHIAREGYDPVYGARPLKRYLQREVETRLSRKLLSGDIPDGSALTLAYKDGHLDIQVGSPKK
jgi:hypothetical protein